MFDVKKIRKDFKILERKVWDGKSLVYFDNAATTQKPEAVVNALVNYYENYNANIHRGVHKLAEEATVAYEAVREKVKLFIGIQNADHEAVFTRNTTESINLLAYTLGENLNKDDEVLLTEMEHHSNLVPWFQLKERKGIKIKFIPITKGYELDYDLLKNLITDKTKIISVTHKSNVLGTLNDIKKIANVGACHGKPLLIVDAAQSIPHMKVDFQDLGCDFMAFSSHKMCGPTGVGVLVGKKELFEKMSPFMGGGEMIRKVTFEGFTPNDVPWKFEAGTPSIADVIAFGAAIDYLQNIGIENIYKYEIELTEYCLSKLKKFDFLKIYNPIICHSEGAKRPKNLKTSGDPSPSARNDNSSGIGIVTFSNPLVHPHDIATIVDQYGVAIRAGHHCAQPLMKKLNLSATARASFYFYNTKEEIDSFIEALNKAFDYFKIGACKELNSVEAYRGTPAGG